MKDRPLLMSAPMVRVTFADLKTQTRRIVKHQPPEDVAPITVGHYEPTIIVRGEEEPGPEIFGAYDQEGEWGMKCPYGQPGDRLWVRESVKFRTAHSCGESGCECDGVEIVYIADGKTGVPRGPIPERWGFDEGRAYPSIHMPRWASRLNLEILEVRVQRLQDITEADALAEGIQQYKGPLRWVRFLDAVTGEPVHNSAVAAFRALWECINPGTWDSNPWVWAITFKRLPAA
jgi:hypothetical protein